MVSVPVFNMQGTKLGSVDVDEAQLGGRVRPELLKQALVAYQDHQRQGSARTKSRAQVEGSTRQLYRQKGTGHARAGMIRTPVRKGGGRAFAKMRPPAVKEFPKKMRRAARNSAILAKMQANEFMVVDGLRCSEPKTKVFAAMLSALKADKGCVVAMHERDANVYKSGRNIPVADIRMVDEVTAYELLRRPRVIFTKGALERVLGKAK
jgi:large subunit ribosomal protein L4